MARTGGNPAGEPFQGTTGNSAPAPRSARRRALVRLIAADAGNCSTCRFAFCSAADAYAYPAAAPRLRIVARALDRTPGSGKLIAFIPSATSKSHASTVSANPSHASKTVVWELRWSFAVMLQLARRNQTGLTRRAPGRAAGRLPAWSHSCSSPASCSAGGEAARYPREPKADPAGHRPHLLGTLIMWVLPSPCCRPRTVSAVTGRARAVQRARQAWGSSPKGVGLSIVVPLLKALNGVSRDWVADALRRLQESLSK